MGSILLTLLLDCYSLYSFQSCLTPFSLPSLFQRYDFQQQEKGTGNIISCLINNIENVTVEQCHQFLIKMEAIVFSDFRLVHKFVDKCKGSIEKLKCGRLPGVDEDPSKAPHKQGATIACLQSKVGELDQPCRKEILRIRYCYVARGVRCQGSVLIVTTGAPGG